MIDEKYMTRALNLSLKGNPSPNPFVGAVIVKDDKIIGEGYHRKAGAPHAEVEAINAAGNCMGATLYVTVEPCSHHGRTAPCTDAIIDAGIKRVVYALEDPTPKVKGRETLLEASIKVAGGVLEKKARKINEVFHHFSKTGKPFVALKAALTLDGKIATEKGESKWITCKQARKTAHKLRGTYDCILVGVNTILKDDPKLTCRIKDGRDPLRIILDSRLKTPASAQALADGNAAIVTTKKHDKQKFEKLSEKASIWVLGEKEVDLAKLVEKISELGHTSLLVEGGGKVNASFIKADLVNKFYLFFAPKIFFGTKTQAFDLNGVDSVDDAPELEFDQIRGIDTDFLVIAYPKKT